MGVIVIGQSLVAVAIARRFRPRFPIRPKVLDWLTYRADKLGLEGMLAEVAEDPGLLVVPGSLHFEYGWNPSA